MVRIITELWFISESNVKNVEGLISLNLCPPFPEECSILAWQAGSNAERPWYFHWTQSYWQFLLSGTGIRCLGYSAASWNASDCRQRPDASPTEAVTYGKFQCASQVRMFAPSTDFLCTHPMAALPPPPPLSFSLLLSLSLSPSFSPFFSSLTSHTTNMFTSLFTFTLQSFLSNLSTHLILPRLPSKITVGARALAKHCHRDGKHLVGIVHWKWVWCHH